MEAIIIGRNRLGKISAFKIIPQKLLLDVIITNEINKELNNLDKITDHFQYRAKLLYFCN